MYKISNLDFKIEKNGKVLSMIKLKEYSGIELTVASLRYLSIRLKSRPDTSALATQVDEFKNELMTLDNKHGELQERRIGLSSEIIYRDSILDEAVMNISRKILVETKNDRKHELYTKLFKITPTKMMAPITSKEQNQNVRLIVDQLKNDQDYSQFTNDATNIEDVLNVLTDSISKRDGAYIEENKAKMELNILKGKSQRLYNKMYPTLQLILDNKNLIETFFKEQ
jgi:hypothetical protein